MFLWLIGFLGSRRHYSDAACIFVDATNAQSKQHYSDISAKTCKLAFWRVWLACRETVKVEEIQAKEKKKKGKNTLDIQICSRGIDNFLNRTPFFILLVLKIQDDNFKSFRHEYEKISVISRLIPGFTCSIQKNNFYTHLGSDNRVNLRQCSGGKIVYIFQISKRFKQKKNERDWLCLIIFLACRFFLKRIYTRFVVFFFSGSSWSLRV